MDAAPARLIRPIVCRQIVPASTTSAAPRGSNPLAIARNVIIDDAPIVVVEGPSMKTGGTQPLPRPA